MSTRTCWPSTWTERCISTSFCTHQLETVLYIQVPTFYSILTFELQEILVQLMLNIYIRDRCTLDFCSTTPIRCICFRGQLLALIQYSKHFWDIFARKSRDLLNIIAKKLKKTEFFNGFIYVFDCISWLQFRDTFHILHRPPGVNTYLEESLVSR